MFGIYVPFVLVEARKYQVLGNPPLPPFVFGQILLVNAKIDVVYWKPDGIYHKLPALYRSLCVPCRQLGEVYRTSCMLCRQFGEVYRTSSVLYRTLPGLYLKSFMRKSSWKKLARVLEQDNFEGVRSCLS